MKVLLIFHHLRHPDERGGQRSREVAETLVGRGHHVTVLVPNVDPLTERRAINRIRGLWTERSSEQGYREIRYSVPSTSREGLSGRALYSLIAFFNTFLFALLNCRQFRSIAVTSHPLAIAFSALPYRFFGRAKLIVEVRDVPADVAVERGFVRHGSVVYRGYKSLERNLIKRSDAVIAYSWGMLDIVGATSSEVNGYVIPIGVDERHFKASESVNRNTYTRLKFCFFGTLGEVIELESVLKFIRIINTCDVEAILDIYGEGEKKKKLVSRVEKEGLPVFFKGSVSRKSVPGLCAEYDFAVYPVQGGAALSASLGNKFFDYLSAQTPIVVIGTKSEPGRLVEQYGLGICADTPEELASKVGTVVQRCAVEKCTLRSQFRMSEALKVFNKKRLLDQWSEVLESCI